MQCNLCDFFYNSNTLIVSEGCCNSSIGDNVNYIIYVYLYLGQTDWTLHCFIQTEYSRTGPVIFTWSENKEI